MPRMQILTQAEELLFSNPPKFNHSDRKRFFEYPDELLKVAYGFRKEEHCVMFLLAYGYFKATKKFFSKGKVSFNTEAVSNINDL